MKHKGCVFGSFKSERFHQNSMWFRNRFVPSTFAGFRHYIVVVVAQKRAHVAGQNWQLWVWQSILADRGLLLRVCVAWCWSSVCCCCCPKNLLDDINTTKMKCVPFSPLSWQPFVTTTICYFSSRARTKAIKEERTGRHKSIKFALFLSLRSRCSFFSLLAKNRLEQRGLVDKQSKVPSGATFFLNHNKSTTFHFLEIGCWNCTIVSGESDCREVFWRLQMESVCADVFACQRDSFLKEVPGVCL